MRWDLESVCKKSTNLIKFVSYLYSNVKTAY